LPRLKGGRRDGAHSQIEAEAGPVLSAPTTMRFASSLTGTARSHGWLSTKPSSPDIEFRWSSGNTLRQQSTCDWQRYAYEASDCGLLSPDLAAGIRRVKGARRLGVRIGNWLTAEEGRRLVGAFGASTPKERRNRAMIAVLIGCGLRRAEAAALKLEDFQLRDGRWVIADLNGKGGHIRTVPVPDWVKKVIDEWTVPAGLTSGPLFRAINKACRTWGNGFTPKVIWSIVREGAASCGLAGLAPHDLRRTCARLCPGRR